MSNSQRIAALRGRNFGMLACAVRDYLNQVEPIMTRRNPFPYYFTVTPAYGREYKSRAAITKDLLAERDFVLQPEGRYINLQQLPAGSNLNVRYSQNRRVAFFSVDQLRAQQKN